MSGFALGAAASWDTVAMRTDAERERLRATFDAVLHIARRRD